MAVVERTHEVLNQPPPLEDYNSFEADVALREALEREGGSWGVDRAHDFGAVCGSAEAREHSRRALRNVPRLLTHDRFQHVPHAIGLVPALRSDPPDAPRYRDTGDGTGVSCGKSATVPCFTWVAKDKTATITTYHNGAIRGM